MGASFIVTSSQANARLELAKELLQIEARSIERAGQLLGESFLGALELIQKAVDENKKLIFMGVGKSSYIARKLAASFMSTGVTAVFVHPSEAFHGDLGAIRKDDVVILFSKSGRSAELLGLLPFFKKNNPIIAITGDMSSPMSKAATYTLDASVEQEACPINMLPTASTTVALALGDALLSSFAKERGFNRQEFAGYHPGGSIGKRLNNYVRDVFHPLEECAFGPDSLSIEEVAKKLGEHPWGAYCAVSAEKDLLGVVTDGDMRRALARGGDSGFGSKTSVAEIMHKNPVTVTADTLIDNAIATLEQKNRKVNCAPVLDAKGKFLGIVHIHDLI